jgi:hypothetical protein
VWIQGIEGNDESGNDKEEDCKMTKYIIDGEVLDAWERDVAQRAFDIKWQREQIAIIRSHPYQSERDKLINELLEHYHVTTNTDYIEGKAVVLVSDILKLRQQEGKP